VTELAIRTDNPATELAARRLPQQVSQVAAAQPSPLVHWVEEAARAEELAARLAGTSFVPTTLRGKPVEIMAAILAGLELGLQPMATLRSMDVIQGTPALRAHAMRGLVQSHGHKVQRLEHSAQKVVMRGRRKDDEEWQEVTWDIPRAIGLGLMTKPEWKKQPETMLTARATGEICRLIASDVLFAMPYAAEELDGDTLPDGRAFAEPRVTVDEVMSQASAPEVPRPDYLAMAQGATSLDAWREVWNQALSAGHLDEELKAQLVARGQELKAAEQSAIAPVAPSTACGYCMEPGHFEDDCPQRAGDEYASDGAS
jgi:hypothetical protein